MIGQQAFRPINSRLNDDDDDDDNDDIRRKQ
jgi:hypothetical protein